MYNFLILTLRAKTTAIVKEALTPLSKTAHIALPQMEAVTKMKNYSHLCSGKFYTRHSFVFC